MGIRLETKRRLLAILGTLTQPGVVTGAPNGPRGKQEYEGLVFYVVPGRTTNSVLANTLTNATTTWTIQIIGPQVGLKLTVSAEDRMLEVADQVALWFLVYGTYRNPVGVVLLLLWLTQGCILLQRELYANFQPAL